MKNFKKIFILAFLMFFNVVVFAQNEQAKALLETPYEPINQEDISANVHSLASEYYYPYIFKRYQEGDTTLTLEDFRHLYYGYMYDKLYKPSLEPKLIDSLSAVIYKNSEQISVVNAKQVIDYIDLILEERPFSLKFLNLMIYTYAEIVRDQERANLYAFRLDGVLKAIFSSGNGLTEQTAWHILYRDDAQSILGLLGAQITRRIYVSKDCEYYHLTEKRGDVKGYYFDFNRIYTKPFEPTGKRVMEFNPESNPKSKRNLNKNIKRYYKKKQK